jgi:preprotein translocase subunit YajC
MTSVPIALITAVAAIGAPALSQTPTTPASTAPAATSPAATPAPAATAQPQAAGAQVQLTTGTQVIGPDAQPVGTITTTDARFATVKTDKHEVRLPLASFGAAPNGVAIGMTRDQLNASVEQAAVNIDSVLKAGATVRDPQGGVVGTVDATEGDLVTLKLASGKAVRLPKSGFAVGQAGPVVGMTAAQLEAQVAGATAK